MHKSVRKSMAYVHSELTMSGRLDQSRDSHLLYELAHLLGVDLDQHLQDARVNKVYKQVVHGTALDSVEVVTYNLPEAGVIPMEIHDSIVQVIIVVQGALCVSMYDTKGYSQVVTVDTNKVVVIPKGVPHIVRNSVLGATKFLSLYIQSRT